MKPFSWSYSRLKNFESCPHRYNEVDVLKHFAEGDSDQLIWGNKVHDAFKAALRSGTALPDEMKAYQKWADQAKTGPGELLVEQKYALKSDFTPTEWFGPSAWCRIICDVVRVSGDIALAFDWKTGKVKDDPAQLFLAAQCVFAHFPDVKDVVTRFVWLQEDTYTERVYNRSELGEHWIELLGRVGHMERAYNTDTYPKKPGRLCRAWCPVTTCEHNGRKQ